MWIRNIYWWLVAIVLVGVTLHTPIFVWLQTSFGVPAEAKAWKEALLMVTLVSALCMVAIRHRMKTFVKDPVVMIALGLLAWHGMLALFRPFSHATLAGLMIDTRYILAFLGVYSVVKLYPTMSHEVKKFATIGAGIVVVFGVLQATILPIDSLQILGYSKQTIAPYMTIDQDMRFIRINSTLRGPNPLGAYSVIVLAVAGALLLRHWSTVRYRLSALAIIAGSFLTLWRSYSRSAYIAAIVVVAWLGGSALRALPRKTQLYAVLASLGLLICGVLLLVSASGYQTVIHHESPVSSTTTKSDDQHAQSLESSARKVLAQPLGAGIGSTGSASLTGNQPLIVENWYLFVAHEAGWIGLGGFMMLLGAVLYQLWLRRQQAWVFGLLISGVALSVIGIVLPIWTDDTLAITWWGIAGALVATSWPTHATKIRRKKSSQ